MPGCRRRMLKEISNKAFFFLCIFNPMLVADVSGFFRNQAATNSHSVQSVHCFQQKAAMVPLLLIRLLKVKVFFLGCETGTPELCHSRSNCCSGQTESVKEEKCRKVQRRALSLRVVSVSQSLFVRRLGSSVTTTGSNSERRGAEPVLDCSW